MRVFPDVEGPMFTWSQVAVVPGVEESLTRLQDEWTLALATNAADSQERDIRRALERVGLDRLIDRVYCYRKIGHRKPAPEYFDHILSDLGLERDRVVMVGDDFEADVLGANRSGVRAIWFNERSDQERTGEMVRTIHEMSELPEALDALLKSAKNDPHTQSEKEFLVVALDVERE
jgi:putative hydrolase of the HAD superfamily